MTLFTYYKVSCNFKWEAEDDPELKNTNTYSFASLEGARAWVERHRNGVVCYSIEGLEAVPCFPDDPAGQLYFGMIYHDFEWLDEEVAM